MFIVLFKMLSWCFFPIKINYHAQNVEKWSRNVEYYDYFILLNVANVLLIAHHQTLSLIILSVMWDIGLLSIVIRTLQLAPSTCQLYTVACNMSRSDFCVKLNLYYHTWRLFQWNNLTWFNIKPLLERFKTGSMCNSWMPHQHFEIHQLCLIAKCIQESGESRRGWGELEPTKTISCYSPVTLSFHPF